MFRVLVSRQLELELLVVKVLQGVLREGLHVEDGIEGDVKGRLWRDRSCAPTVRVVHSIFDLPIYKCTHLHLILRPYARLTLLSIVL